MPTHDSRTRPHLLECHDCGTVLHLPAMRPGEHADCPVCDAGLRTVRRDPFTIPLALNVTSLVMFSIGSLWSLMSVSTAGQARDANLLTGPTLLESFGLWELSLVVLATTVVAPLLRILCMIAVLIGLRFRYRPPGIRLLFAWVEHLRRWSMVEIFLLGLFVAFVRLSDIAHIDLGPAVIGLGALTVTMVAGDLLLDHHAVWEALDQQQPRRPPRLHRASTFGAPLRRIGCHTCGLTVRGEDGTACPRCGFTLQHRKPHSLSRSWALVIAAMILYVPANLYPILTVIRFGSGQPSTILGGVRELLEAGMWPLAALVFFASIAVPVLKLIGMIVLLLTTWAGSSIRRRDRTVLYRIVEAIGRWSMIDIFMETILVALVQFGAVVTIIPGTGSIAFASVVILTMLSAQTYDPRLLWDSPEEHSAAESTPV